MLDWIFAFAALWKSFIFNCAEVDIDACRLFVAADDSVDIGVGSGGAGGGAGGGSAATGVSSGTGADVSSVSVMGEIVSNQKYARF